MPENEETLLNAIVGPAGVKKTADILQSTFEHHYRMAMDHHTKAGSTSNILLIIIGALVTLLGFDKELCGNFDLGCAIAIIVLGLFGMVWVWKQHERYYYWAHIAKKYQEELTKIAPMLKPEDVYKSDVQKETAKRFLRIFVRHMDPFLWLFMHFFVVIMGAGLVVRILN